MDTKPQFHASVVSTGTNYLHRIRAGHFDGFAQNVVGDRHDMAAALVGLENVEDLADAGPK